MSFKNKQIQGFEDSKFNKCSLMDEIIKLIAWIKDCAYNEGLRFGSTNNLENQNQSIPVKNSKQNILSSSPAAALKQSEQQQISKLKQQHHNQNASPSCSSTSSAAAVSYFDNSDIESLKSCEACLDFSNRCSKVIRRLLMESNNRGIDE